MRKKRESIKNSKNILDNSKTLSQTQFINLLFQTNIENNKTKVKNLFLFNKFSLYKNDYYPKLFRNTNYISKTINSYKSSFNYRKNCLNSFLYSILFLLEDNKKHKEQKNIFLNHFLLILEKFYKEKNIEDENLLLLIKLITYLSIYDRKEYPETKLSLPKLRIIKNYQIFKFSIDIVIKMNEMNLSNEYVHFLKENITKYKPNLFMITKRVDILEMINLYDKKDIIVDFLAKIYSFRYSKLFLDVFIKKINEIYDIKNKEKKTINVLQYLNRDLILLSMMQRYEKKQYLEDPYLLSHGFVINNNEKTKIILKEIIIKENFSMIFSFCYSPDEKENKELAESKNKAKQNKNKNNNIPIIDLIKEGQSYNEVTGFSFYIRDNYLYHRKFNSSEELKLCEVAENKTYICYYGIKEYEHFIINIKPFSGPEKNIFEIKDDFKSFLKSKLNLSAGRFFTQTNSSFTGYIGPIILFKCCFNPELRTLLFGLKGSYEKMLFLEDYNFQFITKYDKDYNCPFMNDPNDKNNNFIECKKKIKAKNMNVKENLIFYLTPVYEGSSLNKKEYVHSTLQECRIIFGTNPKPEGGAAFFFRNSFTPFEFIKYEGINFLILVFELIVSNTDNIAKYNENDRVAILNIFSELIPYIQELIYLLNVKFYEKEIRSILFAMEKCINKICKKIKMCSEIGHQLNNWIRSLTMQESQENMESILKIRNEMIKFLLNTELYDINEFCCVQFFFGALNFCLTKRPEGLINMEFLKKILSFTDIFKSVTKQKNIRKTRQFKSFKVEMISLLRNFLKRSEYITPYIQLYQIISENNLYDFRKYQFVKIFYLESKYYFDNINNDKGYVSTWKYFISLFKYLQSCDSFTDITQKQAEVLMALSLRIIIEYPLIGNFFKENIYKNKRRETITFKKKQKMLKMKSVINITPLIDSNIKWSDDPMSNEVKKKVVRNNSPNYSNKFSKDLNFCLYNINAIKNGRNYSADKETFKYKKIKNNDELYVGLDFNEKDNKKPEEENNQTPKEDINFFGYVDFFTYNTLMDILDSTYKLNDYTFRAILLFILENNNNVTISQEIKLKFILKVKKFDDLKDDEFVPFLKFSYINRETKAQLIKLVNMVSKNYQYITHITYDIFLYLIILTCEKRTENKCTFNHLIKSKKVCNTIFFTALNHNQEAYDLILKYFLELIILTLPYHKQSFVSEFIYELLVAKNTITTDYGQILVNMLLLVNSQDVKDIECFYHIKLNSIHLLYRAVKSYDFIQCVNKLIINVKGLIELYEYDLINLKVNIFKDTPQINKKKCYAEALFEILLYLCIYSNKMDYYSVIYQIFIMNLQHYKVVNDESKSIIYYIDEIKGNAKKNNKALKIFNKPETIEIPCLSLQFLLKTLKYRYKCQDEKMKTIFSSLITSFYFDTLYLFKKHSSKKKKYKNKVLYNYLCDYFKQKCSKKQKIDFDEEIKELIKNFEQQYSEILKKKNKNIEKDKEKVNEDKKPLPSLNSQIKETKTLKNEDNDNLNDSFSSCKSSKETKNTCANNKKIICKTINKRKNIIKKIYKKIDKDEDPFDLDKDDDNMCNSSVIQSEIPMSEQDFSKSNVSNIIAPTKKEKDFSPILFNINNEKNPFSLDKIESQNKCILFPKSNLMEQKFAIFFLDRLFYNKPFIKMKQYFKYYVKKNNDIEINTDNFFNYPIIMKNYISSNLYFGGLFLKHDLDFFKDRYFNISHPYFKDKVKDCIQKRIFRKISEQDDINQFLNFNSTDKKYEFYVDLVTNRNAVFGKLTVYKYLLYFENVNRAEFLKQRTDSEKIDYLLCSQECDYSQRSKKLYIFKKEITEIINRRFLYSFQACEIYLNNGKSYFFNFYSDKNKIDFVNIIHDQTYNIKIISDLKTEFRNKKFTENWLKNRISTLAYLLFVNKYACRSYNDVNQYPIFPWLELYEEKERDLRYTIAAQTEEDRMMLKEKYPFSSEHFPYHYTTHYSNASFLIYYLIRINPFTDNQINLQVNKFDVPDRQFHSLDEIQKILYTTKQPREVIPEFFMSTEFFYNYNCNYFGVKNNTKILVNDLINKKKFKTPLEFVLNNEVLLESPKFKSTINYFIDNIFGTGQMGGCDRCNTYDKYSYQEMVDLHEKIKKFKENKLKYEEVRQKILRKSNKIISFGKKMN